MASVANNKVPPSFDSDSGYESWRKDIEIWCLLTDVAANKQALAIHLRLTGKARMVSSEIAVTELHHNDGVKTLLAKLDAVFLQDKGRRQFSAFQKLYNLRRKDGVGVTDFIAEFEHNYFEFTKQEMKLPDTVIAFMLLASMNLDEKDVQMVMSGVSDVSSENMKSALKRIFGGGFSGVSMQKLNIKDEPIFECDGDNANSEALFTRGRGRQSYPRGSRGLGRQDSARGASRRHNPIDKKTGNISRCAICGSKFHWASKCPDAYENTEKTYLSENQYVECDNFNEDEEVYLSLFIGYSDNSGSETKLDGLVKDSLGSALLDSGCSKTVCGEVWLNHYIDNLSEFDRNCVKQRNTNASFTFGGGCSEKSIKRLVLPCYIAGKRCLLESDVVKCNIPLLLSKRSMKKCRMSLDFGNDTAVFEGTVIPLKSSTSGHYLLPLSM